MHQLPLLVQECLNNWFGFPQNELYCQVATLSENNPHIRTMKLYDINTSGNLVLFSRIKTTKWTDLKQCNNIAICMLQPDFGQILVEGTAVLKTLKDDASNVRAYWENLPALSREYYSEMGTPDSFGVIFVVPKQWEVLQVCKEDYKKTVKKQFKMENSIWVEVNLAVATAAE